MQEENRFNVATEVPYGYAAKPAAYATLMRNVYLWMTLALFMTGMTAYYVSNSYDIMNFVFSSQAVFFGFIIAELALVWGMSAFINRISFPVAGIIFALYSILNGVTLSVIFIAYAEATIITAFFTTAGTFGALALFGTITKRDLSMVGRIAFMALIGLIIASVVNIFWGNGIMDLVISYAGVLIFTGLTAYDAQKIKNLLLEHGTEENDSTLKITLLGSLELYLDFINLFLYILRLLGRKD